MGSRLLVTILIGYLQAPLAQPPPGGNDGPGGDGPQGPRAVEVTLSGTLSLTGSSFVTESQEALRGLNLGLDLQSLLPTDDEGQEQEIEVKLDIRDDEGDPERCRSLYADMLQTYRQQGQGYQIFLGPISQALSEVAANITTGNEQLLILPFTSLPEVQAVQSPASVFSLAVPVKQLLKFPVLQVVQGGAKTLAIWADADPFYTEMCDGAVQQALRHGMEIVFQRDLASNLFLLEQTRQIAATRPDVLLVCQDYPLSVELMVTLDFIHFQPNAFIIWDSVNRRFYEPLLVSGGIDILSANFWSNRSEPCGVDCFTATRAEFFESYENLHNAAPSFYAAQAAAAGIAATYLIRDAFSPLALDVLEDADKLDSLSTALREAEGAKESFYHPLSFDSQGYMSSAHIEVTQLSVQNFSETRRLQTPQGPQTTLPPDVRSTPPPGDAPAQLILVEPLTSDELSAFTTLQPVVRGVYVLEWGAEVQEAQGSIPSLSIVYPRLLEEKRDVLQYPCDLGFEVRMQSLWRMINDQRRNLTGGPISPCVPCDRGLYRSEIGSKCSSCPVGTQATQEAQSECTECLQGTVCHSAATERTVAPGFHEAYGLLLPCDIDGRCLGENQCLGNSRGVRCAQCNSGYATDPERALVEADPCRPCDEEWAREWPRLTMEIGMYILLYVILLFAHWNSCVSLMSTSCFILRSVVNYLQFMAITLKATSPEFINNNMKNTSGYFLWLSTLILDPMQRFPIECLSSTWKRYQVKALLGLCLIPAVIVTVLVMSALWEFIFGPLLLVVCPPDDGQDEEAEEDPSALTSQQSFKRKGKSVHHSASLGLLSRSPSVGRCVARVAESCFIWGHLLLPMAVFNLLDALRCVDPKDAAVAVVDYPRPISVLLDDFGVQCSQGDHTLWTVLCILGIILYGIGVPAGMMGLISALFRPENWKSHRAFGYLIDGSSSDYLYIQIIIMFVMVISLALASVHFIPLVLRVVWLLSLYAAFSLIISDVVPFDARDQTVLLKLELCSMLGQKILLVGYVLKSGMIPFLNGLPGEVVEVPWVVMHVLFALIVLKHLINNLVIKKIRYCISKDHLTSPELFLYDVLGVEDDKVILDVASGILDLRGLTSSSRQTLQETLRVALERYFKASTEGLVPWTQVCDPKQNEDGEPEMDVLDPARPGQLHTGFLSAAIYESLLEVEASRELRRLHESSGQRRGWLAQFCKADARQPTMDMESIQGDFSHGAQVYRRQVEQSLKQKPELKATSEEMYMAMTLLLKSILKGHVDLYDLQKKALRSQRAPALPDEDRSIQDILEEVSTKQGEFEDDISQEGSEIFEVPEPRVAEDEAERPVPALLRIRTEVPRPDDHPNAALARTLGIRHVSNVQEKLSTMQETHDKKYRQAMELRAEIQELHRSLAEAEAKYAQMERETTTNNVPADVPVESLDQGPRKAPRRSPRLPKSQQHLRGANSTMDYVADADQGAVKAYPYEKWTSSKATLLEKKKRRREKASIETLAPNMKESTIEVADNSFWSKATT